jgi:hypothetical protein
MTDQAEQDIEFLPSDELAEPEPADAEDAAVRPREPEEPRGLMTVEAEDFEADRLDEDVADELEVEADEEAQAEVKAKAELAEAAEDEAKEVEEEEHEEDLEEILQRHYGILSAEPEEAPARAPSGAAEFLCGSCFLRKPTSQLADPERSLCIDCAINSG